MKWLYLLFALPIVALIVFMAFRSNIPVPGNIVFDANSDVSGYAFILGTGGEQSGILYHTPVRKMYADPLIDRLYTSVSPANLGPMGVDVFGCFSTADRFCTVVDDAEAKRGNMAEIKAVLNCTNGDKLLLTYTYGKGTITDPDSQSVFTAMLKLDNNRSEFISFSKSVTFQGEPRCGDNDAFSQEVKDAFEAP